MSAVTTVFLDRRLNLVGAFVTAVAEAISWWTTVDDAYHVTPIGFGLCIYFIAMVAVREHIEADVLRERLRPKAELVFDETERTVFVQEGNVSGAPHTIYRVGVVGLSGTQVDSIRVVLESAEPHEPHVTYPNSPLKVHRGADNQDGVFTLRVGDGVTPSVYVEVLEAVGVTRHEPNGSGGFVTRLEDVMPAMRVRYASHALCDPTFKTFRKLNLFPKVLRLRMEGDMPASRLELRVSVGADGKYVVTKA